MRTNAEKLALAIGLVCAVIAALTPMLIVPHFSAVFKSFGTELPLITKIFLNYNFVFWLMPLAVIVAWVAWPTPHRRALAACLIGVIGMLVMVPVLVGAMYLPIFMLSAHAGGP